MANYKIYRQPKTILYIPWLLSKDLIYVIGDQIVLFSMPGSPLLQGGKLGELMIRRFAGDNRSARVINSFSEQVGNYGVFCINTDICPCLLPVVSGLISSFFIKSQCDS